MTKNLLTLAAFAISACCLFGKADTAKDSKSTTPRQRYEALVKEYEAARSEFFQAYEKAKTDAEKALMDKVHSIGQAFVDADAKKLKDVKAQLSPDEIKQLQAIGVKMIHPMP